LFMAQVDARLTPLSAMGLDRGSLIHDGLRLHGGVVYPGIRALPADKSRETPAHTLTYNRDGLPELIYKPDGPLDSRKPTNGYLGLYKGTPPGLHKPLLLHGAEGLGLERRLGPGEKASELGLAGAGGSYLRLPWLSPYPEASMYPFMDTSKYAALNMYKASLLSQPNPYLAQHLAYPSLCASQGGNVNPAAAVSAAERLYYMPPYPPSPISSPLVAPPMRIPTVTVAPTPMVHCQDKGLAVASQFTQQLHQPSPHPQHHQAAMDRDRSPSRGSRPSRPPSRKGSSNNSNTTGTNSGNNNNSQPSDSSPHASSRLPQPPPPPALIDNSLDLQRPVARIGHPPTSSTSSISVSSSSAQSIPHPFSVSSMASEQPSPARSSSHKSRPRDGAPEHRNAGVERRPSRSPSKPNFERPAHQPQATKDSAEKPLDLSGRLLEFGLPPNGYPVKMDALGSGPRYGLPPSRELLKDKKLSLSPSSHPHSVVSSTSTKVPERPEMISTLHSSWVVPSPSPSRTQHTPKGSSPSVIKHKGLERVLPQQRSSSCPRTGESNLNVSSTQHSSLVSNRAPSPKPNGEWVKHSPSQSEHQGHHREGTEKSSQTTKRGETTPELSSYKRPCLENGHTPGHLYLPQSDAYLNHSLAYANRYLHYPIPDGMALHSLPIAGKGPVYPHPVLLGSNSLYPTHLAAKHPLPYHNLAAGAGGEYLTYNSQEMAHPLMQTHSDKLAERGDATLKPRGQEKSRGIVEECVGHKDHSVGKENGKGSQIKSDREAGGQGHGGNQSKHPSSSGTSREKIVCIDLVHSDTDIESSPTVNKQPSAENISKVNQNECCHSNQNLTKTEYEPKHQHRLSHPYPIHSGHSPTLKSNHTERQPDTPFGNFAQAEHSPEVRSPSPDPDDQDQSTLRCARTSGERSSGKDKRERDSRAPRVSQHCTDVVKEERTCEGETENDGLTSPKGSRRSSLAKRIANSSGYVGDRFKCVTTELYADSSKLSREQRALQRAQRAMMRFSELELKEKEGGGSAAAAGRELADGQRRERVLEHCQHTTRPGERGGVSNPARTTNTTSANERRRRRGPEAQSLHRAEGAAAQQARCRRRLSRRAPDQTGEGVGPAAAGGPVPEPAGSQDPARRAGRRGGPQSRDQQEMGLRNHRPRLAADLFFPILTFSDSISLATGASRHAALPDSSVRSLINQQRVRDGLAIPSHPPPPISLSLEPFGITADYKNQLPPPPPAEREYAEPAPPTPPRVKHPHGALVWARSNFTAQASGSSPRRESHSSITTGRLEEAGALVLSSSLSPSDIKHGLRRFSAAPPLPPHAHLGCISTRSTRQALQHMLSFPHTHARAHTHAERAGSLREPRGRPRQIPSADSLMCHLSGVLPLTFTRSSALLSSLRRPPVRSPPLLPVCPVGTSRTPWCWMPDCRSPRPEETFQLFGFHSAAQPSSPAARGGVRVQPRRTHLCTLTNSGRLKEVVLYCLENRVCEVNHRDYAGYCALHEACARGWLTIVQHLLDYGADINCSAQDGTRPIHDAVENDHLDVVRVLLSYGADPTLATYSGRGLLKMTHSDGMERFLSGVRASFQDRGGENPDNYSLFFSLCVSELSEEGGVYDILADAPGPEDEEEDDKREVFEFEFSDRPLLPCYNIQVSLSQGPRNWLLLSDVLRRMRMSGRGFRTAFPHMEVVTVAEAEFYRQASLSQLFSCPEELEGFHADSKDLLDLVEDSGELAALLGSTLECLDDRWDRRGDRLK
uniref:BCL6 corepressor n=1 Tax=Gasterosteus aculeatus TaxID=69293 RepID=G3NA71_GASAC